MSEAAEKVVSIVKKSSKSSQAVMLEHAANELVFAVVGHVGSGTSAIASQLASLLEEAGAAGDKYEVSYIKATTLISAWATKEGKSPPKLAADQQRDIGYVTKFQDLGDAMRSEASDHAAVAKAFALKIRSERAAQQKVAIEPGAPVLPDGSRRAYVLDSIRHPAEVELLRHIYQDTFFLIGVVCDTPSRIRRVAAKYNASPKDAEALMQRDARAKAPNGQRVSAAFHRADFFIDNTPDREAADKRPNPLWNTAEKLSRFIKIVRQKEMLRPESAETAMWHAQGAAMRSACLSRQVGAALTDRDGNVIATGANEVPRAGGGVYGQGFERDGDGEIDDRCAYRKHGGQSPFCSNTREQRIIAAGIVTAVCESAKLEEAEKQKLTEQLLDGRVGDLIEFSRAIHAEMDAILSAARKSVSTIGTRLFVTTFPCHYCARHVVTAGIDEVQYIEPYPKSLASELHSDSIQTTLEGWVVPSERKLQMSSGKRDAIQDKKLVAKVLFRPFAGVAPRMYRRAFFKDAELKDKTTGDRISGVPEWGSPWHLRKLSYAELEVELEKEVGSKQ